MGGDPKRSAGSLVWGWAVQRVGLPSVVVVSKGSVRLGGAEGVRSRNGGALMGQYHHIVNLDQRCFIDPGEMGNGLKLMEFGQDGIGAMAGLWLLLGSEAWAGDRIAILGDYAEPGDLPAEVIAATGVDPVEAYGGVGLEDASTQRRHDFDAQASPRPRVWNGPGSTPATFRGRGRWVGSRPGPGGLLKTFTTHRAGGRCGMGVIPLAGVGRPGRYDDPSRVPRSRPRGQTARGSPRPSPMSADGR